MAVVVSPQNALFLDRSTTKAKTDSKEGVLVPLE